MSANSQAIQQHPLRNSLNSLQTPNVLTDLQSSTSKPIRTIPLQQSWKRKIVHKMQDKLMRKNETKLQFRKSKKPSLVRRESALSSFGASMHEMDLGDTVYRETPNKDKLVSKMMSVLSRLKDDEQRKQRRSSSFWFSQKEPEQFGHLIQLKTLDPNKGNSKVTSSEGENETIPDDTAQSITRAIREGRLCLKPWLMNPNSNIRQVWDLVILMAAVVYTAIRVPLAIAFDLNEFHHIDVWFVMNRIVDTVFIGDMIIIMLTAQTNGKKLVTSHRRIAIRYLKTWWALDFVASIPLDFIFWLASTGGTFDESNDSTDYDNLDRSAKIIKSLIKMFRIVRILRLLRVKRVALIVESFFDLSLNVMTIGKFILALTLLAHLASCGFLWIANPNNGWMEKETLSGINGQKKQYIASIYWTLTTMSTIGYGDVRAITMNERIFSIIAQFICAVAFMYSVTRVIHIITAMNRGNRALTESLESVNEWSKYHDFPEDILIEIQKYLRYKASRAYFDEKSVLSGLSHSLRGELTRHVYESSMKEVELFQQCSTDFLNELMLRMSVDFAQPYSIIIGQGSIGDSMYVIRKGFAAVYRGISTKDIQSAVILGKGQAFGEIALLADNILRTASVVALEWVDLAVLTRDDFESLILLYPAERYKIEKYAENKIKKWKLIRSRERQRKRNAKRAKRALKADNTESRKSKSPNQDKELKHGDQQRPRRRSQSENSHLSSTGTRLSDTTDTKSVSEDIRRYRSSIRARSQSDINRISGSYSIVDDTNFKKVQQNRGGSLDQNAPRERSDSVNVKFYKKKSMEAASGSMDVSQFLIMFPDDMILKQLCRMKKEMGLLEQSWAAHLDKKESAEQMLSEKDQIKEKMQFVLENADDEKQQN